MIDHLIRVIYIIITLIERGLEELIVYILYLRC
jgi:hypothetical protein